MSKINSCTYRSNPRCDWLTLSYPHSASCINDLTEIIYLVLTYFNPIEFEIDTKRRQITAKTQGFYLRIIPFNLSIQIQGYFFTMQENPFNKVKRMAIEISELLNKYFNETNTYKKMHISRFDIAQDFFNLLPDHFRNPINNKDYKSFSGNYSTYSKMNKGCEDIDTGFLIRNPNWEISCYRKDIENKEQKNKDKKIKTQEYLGNDIPVTRFEVRLLQSSSCLLATYFFYTCEDEVEICKKILLQFYQRRKYRIPNLKDSNKDRWPENKIWKDLFVFSEYETSPKSNFSVVKNEITLNSQIAKKNLTQNLNNAAYIISKLTDRHKIQEILTLKINQATINADLRREREMQRKTKTEAFYAKLSPQKDNP